MTPARVISLIAGGIVGTIVLVFGVFVWGVRTKSPTTLRVARVLQRDFVNPQTLRRAGLEGAPWAVIRHTGRRTGRTYETPIGATAESGGFVVMLPYGTGAQWVRNVRASGAAVLTVDGREHHVVAPEVVPIELIALSAADRTSARIFGVRHALRLRLAGDAAPG